MKVAVRADASAEIGTGHLRRCLSLAAALIELGAEPCFVIRRHDSVAENVMASSDLPVIWLSAAKERVEPQPGDVAHAAWAHVSWQSDAAETMEALKDDVPQWVIVDHYAFDARWHSAVRDGMGCRILAVDDLGDRALSSDVLLDGNSAASHAEKYASLLSPGTRMLVGPRFAPLSPTYRKASKYVFSPEVRSIGVFMGGTDAGGVSGRILGTLREDAGFQGAIEVVSTSGSPHLAELSDLCAQDRDATLTVDLPELSGFYARHDLQIGAGGTSSYERCCIGVPTVAVVLAVNQLAVVPTLIALDVVRGAVLPAIEATMLLRNQPALGEVVSELINGPELRRALSQNSRSYVDGRGAERVALTILADRLMLRDAASADCAMLHAWRNDPITRAASIDSGEIAYADHVRWLATVLESADRRLFVAMIGTRPVGAIRFDRLDDGVWEVSLYMDPGLHGMGLGTRMLLAGETAIAHAIGVTVTFRAQIVPGNEVSRKMFERVGYEGLAGRLFKLRDQEDAA